MPGQMTNCKVVNSPAGVSINAPGEDVHIVNMETENVDRPLVVEAARSLVIDGWHDRGSGRDVEHAVERGGEVRRGPRAPAVEEPERKTRRRGRPWWILH